MNKRQPLKICHLCNWAPGKAGMSQTVLDMVEEERRLGHEAFFIDVQKNNPFRKNNHPAVQDGVVIGIEDQRATNLMKDCDIYGWHRYMPQEFWEDKRKNLVLFLHGRPDHVFLDEEDASKKRKLVGNKNQTKDRSFALIKSAYDHVVNCRAIVGLWDVLDKGFWKHLLKDKLFSMSAWANTDIYGYKNYCNFNPKEVRLATFDTWRSVKNPYYVINAARVLMYEYEMGLSDVKYTLDIYGNEPSQMDEVWLTLTSDYLGKFIFFRGYAQTEEIFNNSDIIITSSNDETRIVRESLANGICLVADADVPFTSFQANYRDPYAVAMEIKRASEYLESKENQVKLVEDNREYAKKHFDIKQNITPVIDLFYDLVDECNFREILPETRKTMDYKVEPLEMNFKDDYSTKVLNCTFRRDKSPFINKKVDNYFWDYEQICIVDQEYIDDFDFSNDFIHEFFDIIYVDYYDCIANKDRHLFDLWINKLITKGGVIVKTKVEVCT